MSYDIVYTDNGDIVAEFDTREEAHKALARMVEEKPHVIGQLGIVGISQDGEPAGPIEPATELLAHA